MSDPRTFIVGDGGAPNLAVDVLPDVVAGTFVWDVSEWDGPDLLGWEESSDGWVNVVCDVARVAIRRGAARHLGVLTRTEAGTCTLTIRDVDRRFDPTANADVIHPNTPVRVRAWGHLDDFEAVIDGGGPLDEEFAEVIDGGSPVTTGPALLDGGDPYAAEPWSQPLFTGTIGDVAAAYAKSGPPVVTVLAHDLVGPLARWEAIGRENPGVGAGDDLLGRTYRVLDEMSRPHSLVADDIDPEYTASLAPTTLARGWSTITDAADAEIGRVWVNRDNRLVLRARNSQLTGALRGTLSDIHDEIAGGTVHCCYDDAEVVYGTELLANRAIAGRRIPTGGDETPAPVVVVQLDDEYSQARYDVHAIERRNLELEADGQLGPWAAAMLLDATEPELRVDSVSVAPYNAPESWPQVAATDIGDRWAFRLHPELGPPVSRTLGVLGIEHDITPERWTCRWLTVEAVTPGDANPSGWFAWDVSEWDGPDLLAPVGGPIDPPGGTAGPYPSPGLLPSTSLYPSAGS